MVVVVVMVVVVDCGECKETFKGGSGRGAT